jgi:hypothetical protein
LANQPRHPSGQKFKQPGSYLSMKSSVHSLLESKPGDHISHAAEVSTETKEKMDSAQILMNTGMLKITSRPPGI